jgi:DNA-directed RNA polymerase subunit RPC12/RpoP
MRRNARSLLRPPRVLFIRSTILGKACKMKCEYCGRKLVKIDRRDEMVEMDDQATDGQMADYFAAELSGDYGAWGIGIIEYYCSHCKRSFEVISDALKDYYPLIIRWHRKATDGDYFSRFVFEYLAFIAHLKNNLFISATSDRQAIQLLKQDTVRERIYLQTINRNRSLCEMWQSVIAELNRSPLHNTSHDWDSPEIDAWWNSIGNEPDKKDRSQKGIVRSLSDWGNMVEFWYGVRNNLFHGGKDPDIQRDCFIVEHAYRTLAVFMDNEMVAASSR